MVAIRKTSIAYRNHVAIDAMVYTATMEHFMHTKNFTQTCSGIGLVLSMLTYAHAADAAAAAEKPNLRLTDISAITQVAVGGTSGDGEELEWSQSGAHDPRRDAFDFQTLELSIAGVVGPYFRAAAFVAISEDEGLELEEAYAVTTALPNGLEVEAGLMLTEFGRYNPKHTHEFAHIDQPLVIGTMFGSEGTRDIGARVSWLLPTDHFSELTYSLQNGDNATAVSFLGEGHDHGGGGGHEDEEARNIDAFNDLLSSARWVNGWEMGADSELQVGLSFAYGPNEHDTTTLMGIDTVYKWFNPGVGDGAGTLSWTNEVIFRETTHEDDETLDDWGIVSVLVYDISKRWNAGIRIDYVETEEDEDHGGGGGHDHEEPTERLRISPLATWRSSEFGKIRFQYNYTDPDHGHEVHSVWIGLEVLIGTHPAHNF